MLRTFALFLQAYAIMGTSLSAFPYVSRVLLQFSRVLVRLPPSTPRPPVSPRPESSHTKFTMQSCKQNDVSKLLIFFNRVISASSIKTNLKLRCPSLDNNLFPQLAEDFETIWMRKYVKISNDYLQSFDFWWKAKHGKFVHSPTSHHGEVITAIALQWTFILRLSERQ